MWPTFASQQLKLKRQLFNSYHLFSAICPPLSGMLPGNISPGFDITYFPITANRSSQNEPFLTEGGGGKISVLIWMWMKRRINKWPPELVSKHERWKKKTRGAREQHVSLNVLLLLSPCARPFTCIWLVFPVFLPWFPPSARFVTSYCSFSKALTIEKCCLPLCPCSNVYVCSERGCDEFACEPNDLNFGRMN